MALLTVTSAAGASVTTTNANVPLAAAGATAQFIFVNYSEKPARVFFDANNGLVLNDEVGVGLTSAHSVVHERGVLVDGGVGTRVTVRAAEVDSTAGNNTVTIRALPVHSPSGRVEVGVALESDINTDASI